MSKFKYNPGDRLGPHSVLMLERTYKDKNEKWHGLFECPICQDSFESIIGSVSSGRTWSCGCRKFKIKLGDKYNHWNVIERAPDRNGRVYWKCQCDCGNYSEVTSNHLLHNKSTQCMTCANSQDLIGKKFDKLTIIKRLPNEDRNKGNVKWLCRCDCGKEIIRSTSYLNKSTYNSCGCHNREDLTGKIFGELTVLKFAYSKNQSPYWTCQCSCGAIKDILADSLRQGKTKSCGCIKSYGEKTLCNILKIKNIEFIREFKFEKCKDKKQLPFDFYLPNYNCCIEYDGIQHFKETNWNNLKDTQKKDNIKNQYCKDNDIYLIRIPYTDYDILNEEYIIKRLNNLDKYDYNNQNFS